LTATQDRTTSSRSSPATRGGGLFFREFLRAPMCTASILPSSPALATRMLDPLRSHRRPVLVELGPGTGAFSSLVPGIAPVGTRHIAIETNPVLARHLAKRCPWVEVVHGSAADLPSLLTDRGIHEVDVVVSGLPWQCFAGPGGADLINDIASALSPTGAYTQFTYSWTRWTPPARRQRRLLADRFGRIEVSPTVWRNLPPAFVYACTLPGAAVTERVGG
jgi:phosphatidylethanolamine/phosphatidyl-N-methylethanolamine N-methyltransferase